MPMASGGCGSLLNCQGPWFPCLWAIVELYQAAAAGQYKTAPACSNHDAATFFAPALNC